jgi:uncharacterized membrane protein YecN with MAPEG domain
MMLPITLTMAGAAALINIWLAARTSRARRAHGVSIGDGGNEIVARKMRAHSNFVENTPFFLILLGLVELAAGSAFWLWIASILFILGRILHAFGMDRPSPSRPRMIGMMLTALVLLVLAVYAIALPYLKGPPRPAITYASSGVPGASSGGTKLS